MSRIKRAHNQLAYNVEIQINNTRYIIDEITITDLSMINVDMLLGLRFLQYSVQTTIIHEQGITFISHQDNILYITEIHKSRNSSLDIEESKNYRDEELGENIEEFHIANSSIECISLQSLAPNWYRDIKSKKDIDKIVQRLKDIQIIGEIPMKH
jgi:hypothetical protein